MRRIDPVTVFDSQNRRWQRVDPRSVFPQDMLIYEGGVGDLTARIVQEGIDRDAFEALTVYRYFQPWTRTEDVREHFDD